MWNEFGFKQKKRATEKCVCVCVFLEFFLLSFVIGLVSEWAKQTDTEKENKTIKHEMR